MEGQIKCTKYRWRIGRPPINLNNYLATEGFSVIINLSIFLSQKIIYLKRTINVILT